jgi:KAP-like P-loop domain-containing protein
MEHSSPSQQGGDEPSAETGAGGWIHPDDLIDDRALISLDQDEFRIGDVVEEVAELCTSAPTPATVALYGSWGSGKSSLGNLLKARFEANKKIAFARFDAFKYAEVPLRRHFLSQVAGAFGVNDKKFKEDLYASRKEIGVAIPKEKLGALALTILVAAVITTLLAALAAFVIALLSKGGLHDLHQNFTAALRSSVPGIAVATPLLAAALALVGKYLTAETTVEAPSSEEQFEDLFGKLVKRIKKEKKCGRIVIFIDELDRCSPRQVVSALETLRTFLEVTDCIFVVAADQQVLEHALNDAARQATPFNAANPYYSAGSAYLDKIFQFQLQLPPVLPRRLSRYALDLIEKRQGVWAKVANRAELVSVLVPTHVTSPRRVKALLNAFSLLYRLALRRASETATTRTSRRVSRRSQSSLACELSSPSSPPTSSSTRASPRSCLRSATTLPLATTTSRPCFPASLTRRSPVRAPTRRNVSRSMK